MPVSNRKHARKKPLQPVVHQGIAGPRQARADADMAALRQEITQTVERHPVPEDVINEIRQILHALSPQGSQPVDFVRWVPVEDVEPNDYNPNAVAHLEMQLLLRSITADGYTQPVVTIWDAERQKYVIVDGFHRYFCLKNSVELMKRTGGLLPVVVIKKSINDRMAATVRHNRARGKHSVTGMASMVFQMLDNGMDDSTICNELGMEAEELLRLKHITGFSKLFADKEYNRSWVSRNQIDARRAYQTAQPAIVTGHRR